MYKSKQLLSAITAITDWCHLVSIHAAALRLGVPGKAVGEGAARAGGAGVHLACSCETVKAIVSFDYGSFQATYCGLKSTLFLIGLKVLLPLGLGCTISSHTPLSLASRDFMNTPHFLLTLPLSVAWTVIKLWTPDTNTSYTSPHPALPPAPDPPILQQQGACHSIFVSPRSPLHN